MFFFTIYALRVGLELPAVVYSVLQGGCAGDSILELFVADYLSYLLLFDRWLCLYFVMLWVLNTAVFLYCIGAEDTY